MKKVFTAFLAFFLAFSPLLSVSPTVYAEAFSQSTVTTDGQGTAEGGTETTEAGNGSGATDTGVTTTAPPLENPPTVSVPQVTEPPATEAPVTEVPVTETPAPVPSTEAPAPSSQEVTSQVAETTESQTGSQPGVALRRATRSSAPTTTNLTELLTEVTLDATKDADGNYVVRPNGEYTITLQFAENESLQMDNDQPLTYTVPAGFSLANFNNTFAIEIEDSQGTAMLEGNTFNVTNNVVTINFNKSDAALFARLSAMANVEFSLAFKGRFTANSETIQFNSRITRKFTFDQTSNLKISKDAVHAARNATKVDYTLKVTSEGNNTNVVVSDTIVGTALKLNQDVVVTSSIKGPLAVQPVYDLANDKFTVSGINLEHEEVLTITYSANILFGELTNTGLEAETKNIAAVKSDENPDPKTVEKWLQIVYDGLIKKNSGATPIPGQANKYQVNWTFDYNKGHLLTAGGKKMVDALTVPDRSYFTGTGIKITVTKEDGSVEVRNVTWSQLTGLKRRASDNQIYQWEYQIPESDGKASYVVEATAIVDTTGAVANVIAGNYIRIDKLSTSNSVTISSGIGEEMKPTKTAVSVNSQEIVWKITLPVPAAGYNHLVRVIDDIPYAIVGVTQYHDQPFEYIVEGLLPGEAYTVSDRVTGQYRGPDIRFYQNEAKTVEGLLPSPDGQMRHVTITIKTKVNQDWLQMAHDQGYVAVAGGITPVHTNNFSVYYGVDRFNGVARATPKKQTLKKVYKSDRKEEIGGVIYPVFTYEVEVSNPLDGEVIKDTFDTTYLKYHTGGQLTVKGKVDGSDTTDDNGTVTATGTPTGLNITLTNLPKKADGSYYTTYTISYELIVKDEATLNTLNQNAFQNDGIKLSNVAAWNGLTSEEVYVIYHYNPMVDKHLIQDPKDSNSYVATFELVLNEGADDIVPNQPVYTVKDVLSKELRFLPDTIQVVSGNYTLDYGFDRDTNTLTLRNVPDSEKVVIQYSARVLGLGNVSFHNTVSLGEYVKTVTSSVAIASSGTGTASNPSITVIKRDQDNYNKVIPGVTFALSYLDASGANVPVKDKNGNQVTFTTGSDGTFLIEGNQTNLGWVLWKDRTYLLTETTTPTGYSPLTTPIKFVLTDNIQDQTQYAISGEIIDITNERPKTEVEAKKIWKNIGPGVQVPTTWFKLYRKIAGGNLEEVSISEAPVQELAPGTTSVTWTNLYAQDLNANSYSFEVKEVDAAGNPVTPQDYLKEESGLQVTNTFDGRKEIEVTKVWDDNSNQDGKRPTEVTVHLFADGVKIQTVQVTEADGWKYTFTNLPRFKDSQEIVYTVQEDQVAGYQSPTVDGFTITNKRIPEKTRIAVNKIWDDANNQDGIRPLFITAILKADGIEIGRLVITAGPDGSWKGEFTNLDVYRNGVKIDYTVDEEIVPADYTKTITGDATNGFTIKNSHKPVEKKVTFSKVNLGGEEIAGAEIQIYKGTTVTGTPLAEWTSVQGQSHELSLPVGKYVFHEVAAPNGYVAVTDITFQVNYDGTVTVLDAQSNTVEYKNGKLVITDQYDETPKKITFSKVNLGGEEISGAEIEIYAGDKVEGTPVEKWTSEAGKSKELTLAPGKYVFHEVAAPNGYVAVTDITFQVNYDGTVTVLDAQSNTVEYKNGKLVITDQYDETPKKVTFSKVNLGGEEIAGAEIEIYAGDTVSGMPVEKWTSEAGKSKELTLAPGKYVFHEVAAPNGYVAVTDITFQVNYDGTVTVLDAQSNTVEYKDGKLVITDQYDETPKKITFSKVNLGGEEIAGAEIEIYAGDTVSGTPVEKWTSEAGKSKELTLAPGKYVFHEVAAPNGYVAVTDITFQVNYDGTVTVLDAQSNTVEYKNGKLVITDQYDETTIDILVTKKWDDQDNKAGKRPEKITVRLLADGKEVATQDLTAKNDWKHTFTKLPKYKNGKEIVYTITEDKVEGYQTVISGSVAKGFIVQNTYIPPVPPPSTSIPKAKVSKKKLPSTGDSQSLLLSGIGFVILLVGLSGYSWKKRF